MDILNRMTYFRQVGAAGIRLDSLEARVDVLEVSAVEQSKNIPTQPDDDGSKIPKMPSFVSTVLSRTEIPNSYTFIPNLKLNNKSHKKSV